MGFPSPPKPPKFDPKAAERRAREADLLRRSIESGRTGRESLIQTQAGQRRPTQGSLISGGMR